MRLIYHWYMYGDENGEPLSAGAIARRLCRLNLPPPGVLRGRCRNRKDVIWHRSVILQILRSETYAGTWRFGKWIGDTGQKRPEDEIIKVSVPVIIDREAWERVQAQRKRNKAMAKRNGRRDYLLRGIIQCGCEAAMAGLFKQHIQRTYYVCCRQGNRLTGIEKRACFAPLLRGDFIEQTVWAEIEELFSDLDRFWHELKKAQQAELDTQEPKRAELEAIEASIKHTEHEAAELARTLRILGERDPDGVVTKQMQRDVDEINALYREQIKRRDELTADLAERHFTDETIAATMQYARDVREGVLNPTPDGKRRMLESLQVKVKIKEGRYFIKCVVGETDGPIRKMPRKRKVPIATSSY